MKTRKEHSAGSQLWTIGLIALGIVISAVVIAWMLGFFNRVPAAQQNTNQPTAVGAAEDNKMYKSERYGVQLEYPSTWLMYGDENETPNPDLLEATFFVPNYDARKSFEEQPMLSLAVWNNSAASDFDAPKRYINKLSPSEVWEKVTVSGYPGTKITKPNSDGAIYVFERDGKLFVAESTDDVFLTAILPLLRFAK